MSIRENIHQIIDLIKPKNILVSVFEKDGLEELVPGILDVNDKAVFYSTGGTGKKIIKILGSDASKNYISVEDFTGAPEMEGGLVKTLHPMIHAGLLAERGNPDHEEYLFKTCVDKFGRSGVYFDIFVGNLYPFTSVIAKEGTTSETARVNVDIGGPAMTMAAAKNFHSVAVVTRPVRYENLVWEWKKQGGTTLRDRFYMARDAMRLIGEYRTDIGNYFDRLNFDKDVRPFLNIK